MTITGLQLCCSAAVFHNSTCETFPKLLRMFTDPGDVHHTGNFISENVLIMLE